MFPLFLSLWFFFDRLGGYFSRERDHVQSRRVRFPDRITALDKGRCLSGNAEASVRELADLPRIGPEASSVKCPGLRALRGILHVADQRVRCGGVVVSRRKTAQEKRANLPDDRPGSRVRKKKTWKRFLVQHRLPEQIESQFPWSHEWHGFKKFEECVLAEQYVKKQKRCETLVNYSSKRFLTPFASPAGFESRFLCSSGC